MNKILVSSVIALSTLVASSAFAQGYVYPTYNYASGYANPAACVNLTRDLSFGARGTDVTSLQNFLVSQNYPGGGSWMVTGYFGSATLQAVRNFQQGHGLSTTGAVDSQTRAAINAQSCNLLGLGGYTGAYQPYTAYPYNSYNNTSCNNTYPYNSAYPCNTLVSLLLSSFSVNTGGPGTVVTITGTGLDPYGNTLYFGNQSLGSVPSNGTSLTFTVPPYSTSGSVQVYVTNSRGTSNSLTFYLTGYGYNYNYYNNYNQYGCATYANNPYGSGCCGYGGGYYCPPSNTGTLGVNTLNPNAGGVGSSVTVFGSGFSTTGNAVHFGNGIISNINSTDGYTLSFIVPSQLIGFGSQPVGLGTYNVSVSNSSGAISNAQPFTVTSLGGTGAPTITNVNGPLALSSGAQGTWTLQINNPNYSSYLTTSVNWGDAGYGNTPPQSSYVQGGSTLTFTHTYYTLGTFTITFTVSNASGQQNSATATITVSSAGTSSNVALNTLSPTSGHVGSQIMLQGSGFNPFDNALHFGLGGTLHVPSLNNGTIIYYTVPYAVSPCDLVGPGCAAPTQLVVPGSYQVNVSNGNGTSQALSFQVQ